MLFPSILHRHSGGLLSNTEITSKFFKKSSLQIGSDYLDNALRWKNNENAPFSLFVHCNVRKMVKTNSIENQLARRVAR